MRRLLLKALIFILPAFTGCGGGVGKGGASSATGQNCSGVKSVLKPGSLNDVAIRDAQNGLLLTTHRDQSFDPFLFEPLTEKEALTQCNTAIEFLQAEPPRIRMWTASHCIRPLLLTSMKLAIRDDTSISGGFYQWKLEHKLLQDAQQMREVYDFFGGKFEYQKRRQLMQAFDRRNLYVEGASAVLTPRVSCENLRWSLQADERHSLCFSIFDLTYLDVDLPEPDSNKTKALITALQNSKKSASTEHQVAEKRSVFLRRIHLASQIPWIIHQGYQMRGSMTSEALRQYPNFSKEAFQIERLNRSVFSLPHEEEMSFMIPEEVVGQDAIPPEPNTTYSIAYRGNYVSDRTTVNNVALRCLRQLRKYNALSGKPESVAELEVRPREYCYGGSKFEPDHFWDRDRPWSHMVADLAVGAAQEYSKSIFDSAMATADETQRLDRFSIISTFDISDDLGFQNSPLDLGNQLLKHLQIPLHTVTKQLYGFESLSQSGAFMVSLPKDETQARFLKGDSGSILMLDGVPVATLYSVDGEETSGGSSITSLPELKEEDEGISSSSGKPTAFKRGEFQQSGCK